MKELLQQLDDVLCRVPPDSVCGRRVRDEMLDHLAESASERVAAGQGFEAALGGAVAAFGHPEELERDDYRDYLRTRYWLGRIDRESLRRVDHFRPSSCSSARSRSAAPTASNSGERLSASCWSRSACSPLPTRSCSNSCARRARANRRPPQSSWRCTPTCTASSSACSS